MAASPEQYADILPIPCRFPGCGAETRLERAHDHTSALCFDHRQMAFYDWDGFVRLWQTRRMPIRGNQPHPGPER